MQPDTGPDTGDEHEHAFAGRPGNRTRLIRWLMLSHSVPVLLVSGALLLTLIGLVQVIATLRTLAEHELETLHEQGELHRAAWTLDVSMRHAEDDCRIGQPSGPARARVSDSATKLRAILTSEDNVTIQPMRDLAGSYLEIATKMLEQPDCDGLLDPNLLRHRTVLDEQLTNLWVARLAELHERIQRKDSHARERAMRSAIVGIALAVLSTVLAAVVAARSARTITRALATLAKNARQVGQGDFRSPVGVGEAPLEIAELADELESMRLQLAQLENLKQSFLASISHELRTPLSKIRESLALLQDGIVGQVDPRQGQVVRIARRACESEIRIVTTLLDLSRLRAGSPVQMREDVDLDTVIRSSIDDERVLAEERGVPLHFEAEGECPPMKIDPILIERALANLIRNATAVSSRGLPVTVRRLLVDDRPGADRWVCVSVSDEGPGVPAALRDSMFNAFVTRAVPDSPKGLGFGLGLSLSREIARAHGGDIELADEVELGATFRLWLPLGGEPAPRPHQ